MSESCVRFPESALLPAEVSAAFVSRTERGDTRVARSMAALGSDGPIDRIATQQFLKRGYVGPHLTLLERVKELDLGADYQWKRSEVGSEFASQRRYIGPHTGDVASWADRLAKRVQKEPQEVGVVRGGEQLSDELVGALRRAGVRCTVLSAKEVRRAVSSAWDRRSFEGVVWRSIELHGEPPPTWSTAVLSFLAAGYLGHCQLLINPTAGSSPPSRVYAAVQAQLARAQAVGGELRRLTSRVQLSDPEHDASLLIRTAALGRGVSVRRFGEDRALQHAVRLSASIGQTVLAPMLWSGRIPSRRAVAERAAECRPVHDFTKSMALSSLQAGRPLAAILTSSECQELGNRSAEDAGLAFRVCALAAFLEVRGA